MRYILSMLFLLGWALWLGGHVTLFLTLNVLFKTNRDVAMQAGPVLFPAFERFQLIIGVIAIAAALGMRMVSRAGVWMYILVILIIALLPAITLPTWITPKMVALFHQQVSGGDEFGKLHGYSMMLYSATAFSLLLAGLAVPAALRRAKKPY